MGYKPTMIEESEIQKLKNEYPEFFNQFSPEFLKFIFSEKTSNEIAGICLENEIEEEETIEKISYRIALVLLNQIPKENLAKILEKGVKLNHETAEKISVAVKERIFSQISDIEKKEERTTQTAQIFPSKTEEEKTKEISKKDIYREMIE